MEKNLGKLLDAMKDALPVPEVDLRTYSPLTLAFIGDGIYDLVIRTAVVRRANCAVDRLHQNTAHYVKASTQSGMMDAILPALTEEEEAVYKRGRNAKVSTIAKHATMMDYKRATGFEALMGYLYLKEDFGRLMELVRLGLTSLGRI